MGVAILDIRICNTDRHPGNLLMQTCPDSTARFVLVPIDHGCAFPRWWAMGEANFDAWLEWPQAHAPCTPEVLTTLQRAYDMRLQAKDQLELLELEPAAQATHRIALALLYEGVMRH